MFRSSYFGFRPNQWQWPSPKEISGFLRPGE